jgi:hypothetical protein
MSRQSKALAVCGHRAGSVDAIVDENDIASKPPHKPKQASHRRSAQPIHADLAGNDRAIALGLAVQAHTPILSLCRKLIEVGCDPARALHVFRHTILALVVRSIGEGARLTVKTAGNGCPIFALDAAWEGAAPPPERPNGSRQGKERPDAVRALSGDPRHDVRGMRPAYAEHGVRSSHAPARRSRW